MYFTIFPPPYIPKPQITLKILMISFQCPCGHLNFANLCKKKKQPSKLNILILNDWFSWGKSDYFYKHSANRTLNYFIVNTAELSQSHSTGLRQIFFFTSLFNIHNFYSRKCIHLKFFTHCPPDLIGCSIFHCCFTHFLYLLLCSSFWEESEVMTPNLRIFFVVLESSSQNI